MASPPDDRVPSWSLWRGRPGGVRETLWAQLTGRFDPEAVLREAQAPAAGPGAWVSLADLPDDRVVERRWQGRPVAIARRGSQVWVFDGTCPHGGGPLGEGDLVGDTLVCPWHGWAFRLEDGTCTIPGASPVERIAARVVDGQVVVGSA